MKAVTQFFVFLINDICTLIDVVWQRSYVNDIWYQMVVILSLQSSNSLLLKYVPLNWVFQLHVNFLKPFEGIFTNSVKCNAERVPVYLRFFMHSHIIFLHQFGKLEKYCCFLLLSFLLAGFVNCRICNIYWYI